MASSTPEYLYIPLYTPICIKISNIRKMGSDIRPPNRHNSVPGEPPWPEFGMYLPTIPQKVFSCPKGSNFNSIK